MIDEDTKNDMLIVLGMIRAQQSMCDRGAESHVMDNIEALYTNILNRLTGLEIDCD